MRRWTIVVSIGAMLLAAIAGWGIGQMSGGNIGDTDATFPPIEAITPMATPTTDSN